MKTVIPAVAAQQPFMVNTFRKLGKGVTNALTMVSYSQIWHFGARLVYDCKLPVVSHAKGSEYTVLLDTATMFVFITVFCLMVVVLRKKAL